LIDTLLKRRVFGSTCAACTFPILSTCQFRIVILDESSQLLEPVALLPVARFNSSHLLAVGDPAQLPPVLRNCPVPSTQTSCLSTMTLYDRLASCNHPEIRLRTQYRCHPALGDLASELFYDESLANGVPAWKRGPLVRNLPPIAFYDYTANASTSEATEGKSGSVFNVFEAQSVCRCIKQLASRGIPSSDIGVICLYKAQAAKIRYALGEEAKEVQVSTVDAFQGAERPIILVSCSRTTRSNQGDAAFVCDPRRINVTITRARNHLLVFGNASTLSAFDLWKRVLLRVQSIPGGMRSAHADDLLASIAAPARADVAAVPPAPMRGPQAIEATERWESEANIPEY
jgi:superfamily I DNA and/or RNA helicase